MELRSISREQEDNMGDTKIEWADKTWNPLIGEKGFYHCVKISEGCKNCYAERIAVQQGGRPFRVGADRLVLNDKQLEAPLRWKKPQRIFVCSMTDLFLAMPGYIEKIWDIMLQCPQHTFMILTKRLIDIAWWYVDKVEWAPNIWLGTSVENQARATERIPILLRYPAARLFVSLEPLLGPIDLTAGSGCLGDYIGPDGEVIANPIDGLRGLDWVITGGETGQHARPAHPRWFRQIRDACIDHGTPFFFKHWGEWAPGGIQTDMLSQLLKKDTSSIPADTAINFGKFAVFGDGQVMDRVGRYKSGNVLDGAIHQEYPNGTRRNDPHDSGDNPLLGI